MRVYVHLVKRWIILIYLSKISKSMRLVCTYDDPTTYGAARWHCARMIRPIVSAGFQFRDARFFTLQNVRAERCPGRTRLNGNDLRREMAIGARRCAFNSHFDYRNVLTDYYAFMYNCLYITFVRHFALDIPEIHYYPRFASQIRSKVDIRAHIYCHALSQI